MDHKYIHIIQELTIKSGLYRKSSESVAACKNLDKMGNQNKPKKDGWRKGSEKGGSAYSDHNYSSSFYFFT